MGLIENNVVQTCTVGSPNWRAAFRLLLNSDMKLCAGACCLYAFIIAVDNIWCDFFYGRYFVLLIMKYSALESDSFEADRWRSEEDDQSQRKTSICENDWIASWIGIVRACKIQYIYQYILLYDDALVGDVAAALFAFFFLLFFCFSSLCFYVCLLARIFVCLCAFYDWLHADHTT